MRDSGTGFMIVTGYVIVGALVMLASGPVSGLLKGIAPKTASCVRVALLTFGSCVVALGQFGVAMYTVALAQFGLAFYTLTIR